MSDRENAARTVELPVHSISAASFARYGTLIEAAEDGKPFGADEAQLDVCRGTPRFYIMRLRKREPTFRHITRHLNVTQCLAAVGGRPWLIAVAPPEAPDEPDAMPRPDEIRAFSVPGHVAIKLHRGTWHAGPFFDAPVADFLNLELADTNQADHHDCRLDEHFGVTMTFGR